MAMLATDWMIDQHHQILNYLPFPCVFGIRSVDFNDS